MTAPIVTIFVRHAKTCKYREDEFCKRCNCRKHLRWSQAGKQHRRTAGSRTWAGAEEAKRKLEDQLAGRAPSQPQEQTAQTLRTAFDVFMKGKAQKQISQDAQSKYRREIERFIDFCERHGVFTLAGIDLSLLIEFKSTWPDFYDSTFTQSLVQKRLRGFLNFCKEAGWLIRVPKLDPVKVDEPPTLPLTDEEFKRVLEAIPQVVTNGTAAKLRAIILVMRWSGLAVRDASCLRRDQLIKIEVSGENVWKIITSRQKTGTHVSVPIPPEVAQEIITAANGDTQYLFWNPTLATAESYSHNRSIDISKVFESAGIKSEGHMISHRLRDTFAVRLLERGVPLEDVSKMLGHKSVLTTEKSYAAWIKGRQDRLDRLVIATWK